MLPRTTWRITAPPLRRHAFRAYSSAATARDTTPYGEEYGAGPSRLPYNPSFHDGTSTNTRESANVLRRSLDQLGPTTYQNPNTINALLDQLTASEDGGPRRPLSRLEKHVLLHHLIRRRKGRLGLNYAQEFVLERTLPDRNPHDSLISSTSLDMLFKKKLWAMKSSKTHRWHAVLREPRPDPLPQPTIEEQRPHELSAIPRSWLTFLGVLKEHHHPRPARLYERLINQCVHEDRPDEAASVYANLVEDWIMEGRVAEGADPSDFGRGGLPVARSDPASSKSLLNVWFGTVRTWRLPGEAMSLHDRLDLWHPQHDAPDQCLRGFPLPNPTSPPTQVPSPNVELLLVILKSLHLDPHTATPVEYASSMRALAILANTILSRSLPIPAIPRLLKAFSNSHIHPAVYPVSFTQPPTHNAWAYTANTQVHVALVSLMFSPPNYARAAEIQQLAVNGQLPAPEGAARYSLHPLGWQSCLVLINYALHKMMQPRLLERLLEYMKSTFVGWSPAVFTGLFRGARLSRDNTLATAAEESLFKNGPLSAKNVADVAKRAGYQRSASCPPSSSPSPPPRPFSVGQDVLSLPVAPPPNGQDVVALLSNLIATSQFERFRQTVAILIPFLAVNRNTPQHRIEEIAQVTGATVSERGRLQPSDLTPHLFTVILNGLAKCGQMGLGQRVYFLAEQAERRYVTRMVHSAQEEAEARGEDPDIPVKDFVAARLPIHAYTSMMYLYGTEARKRGPRLGWRVPRRFMSLDRAPAAHQMVRRLYRHVIKRYKCLSAEERELAPHLLPDERFFNAAIRAFSTDWGLMDKSGHPPHNEEAEEIARIAHDMAELGIVPPAGLTERLNPPYAVKTTPYLRVENTKNVPATHQVPASLLNYRIPTQRALDTHVNYDPEEMDEEWSTDDAPGAEARAETEAAPKRSPSRPSRSRRSRSEEHSDPSGGGRHAASETSSSKDE